MLVCYTPILIPLVVAFCFRKHTQILVVPKYTPLHYVEFSSELLHPHSHTFSPPDHHSLFDPIRNLPQKQRLKHRRRDPQARTTIKDVRMPPFTIFSSTSCIRLLSFQLIVNSVQ